MFLKLGHIWHTSQKLFLADSIKNKDIECGHRAQINPSVGGGRGQIAHSSYSRHQIPSDTLNSLFPSNIPSKDIHFFSKSPSQQKLAWRTNIWGTGSLGAPDHVNLSGMGQKLIRFVESASSNIVLYSRFIWLNESMVLIRAETERYDIVRFSGIVNILLSTPHRAFQG